MNKAIRLPRRQKRADFVEKSNYKYKAVTDKKRRKKLFEEDIMKVNLRREESQLKESLPSNYIQVETRE